MHDYFPELDGNQSIDNGKLGRTFAKGGGGGKTTETTQNIDPAILPYITYGLDEAKGLYQADGPEYYPGQTYVDPSSQTTSALAAAETRARAGSPLIPAAQSQALSTIQGDRLSAGNPYFTSMMANAAKPAVTEFNKAIRDVTSTSSQAGRYGSSAMDQLASTASSNLADSLSGRAAELAFNNYGQERGYQNQAIANAPQMAMGDYQDINQLMNIGQINEDYSSDVLNSDISRFEYGQNAPYSKLQSYLAAAYGAPAPVNSTSTSSGGGK